MRNRLAAHQFALDRIEHWWVIFRVEAEGFFAFVDFGAGSNSRLSVIDERLRPPEQIFPPFARRSIRGSYRHLRQWPD